MRRDVSSSYRARFDQLYPDDAVPGDANMTERLPEGLALLLSVFQAELPDDLHRLARVCMDLDCVLGDDMLVQTLHTPWRMNTLVEALLEALRCHYASQHSTNDYHALFLKTLLKLVQTYPTVLGRHLRRYYTVLGLCCQRLDSGALAGPVSDSLTAALESPLRLKELLGTDAYLEFASSFLTQPSKLHVTPQSIDMTDLSEAVTTLYSLDNNNNSDDADGRMWLLAHFIELLQATSDDVDQSYKSQQLNLKALYTQLSALSNQIKEAFPAPNMTESSSARRVRLALPEYVEGQLSSLVSEEGIVELLRRFTAHHSAHPEAHSEDASLLAAYTLVLIHSFPSQSDDIRMRLYMVDIRTHDRHMSALRFFWEAISSTSIFRDAVQHEDNALEILRRTKSSQGSPGSGSINLDQEWRSILLFLELYSFVLRLTDDDDFFSALSPHASHNAGSSRLRQNGLSLEQLKPLTKFLKHVSFTIIYSSAELLDPSFSIIQGVDYMAFKGIVTTTMRMLYDRDSRRPFLPKDHWLMTSKFDMAAFQDAVVLENQRQHDLEEQEDGETEQESAEEDMDEDDTAFDEYRALSAAGLQRSQRARMELLRRRQNKAIRDRHLAQVGPKLEILRNMPFIIPFEVRVKIFRQLVNLDKMRRRGGYMDPDQWRQWVMQTSNDLDAQSGMPRSLARHYARIKRGQIFEDAMRQFYPLGDGLKEPIQITFIDQFDTEEAGIDGGGVTKEFLMSVTTEAFGQHSLFETNNKNALYPNPCAVDQRKELLRKAGCPENSAEWHEMLGELKREYEFLGRIIGKCMYDGILINVVFAGFFLRKWATSGSDAGYKANINDLREMDEELYQGLMQLKNYDADVSELESYFVVNDQVSLPGEPIRTVTRNLIPNGENTLVTNENRPLYLYNVARHKLVQQPYLQTQAFLRGLGAIIEPSWLSMFNQNELQRLVGGDSSPIDVDDLRANTQYSGVYQIGDDGEEHPTVKLFWEVMYGLAEEEKRDVLQYVTSTPRAPLLGFNQLRPAFTIRDGGQDQERLPSASTCVNLLKLPQYRTAATLKRKLLYAVQSDP